MQKYKVYINNTSNIKVDNLKNFKKKYNCVYASGGVVFNSKNEVLLIFRNGVWDLPKGKIELNESYEDAALREVTEETGVKNLDLKNFIITTYHTYSQNSIDYLKITNWFAMYTKSNMKLVPQLQEGITKAEWVNYNDISDKMVNAYGNIKDVLRHVEI
tara:strand:- start:34192 stop:34668 length:477 start_codon:yes stop_codon:yes gene_type:complete